MAERAIRKAGYHVKRRDGLVQYGKECIGCINAMSREFRTLPVYESRNNDDSLTSLTNIETVKIIDSIVKSLGLELEKVPLLIRDANYIIKTSEPEKMPLAAKTYTDFTKKRYADLIKATCNKNLRIALELNELANTKLKEAYLATKK